MKKMFNKWKLTILILAIITGIALFIRLYNLDELPVFVDEAIYVRWAQVMKAESTLRFLPQSDGKQPLFMWSIIPFLKIIDNPLIAGRFVSVLTGMTSLIGIFTLSHILFKNKKVSLIASFFYAISPFTVFFDRMALVDSMLSMFGIWTLIFALLTARFLRLDTAMLAGFALGGALLTKSPAIFFVLLIPTTALFFNWKTKQDREVHLIKLLALWGVTWTIGFAMLNILRLGPNFHLLTSRNYDYVFPISHIWQNPKDPFLPFIDRSLEWTRILGPSTILLLLALGVILNINKYRKQVLILLVWAFIPLLTQAEFAKVFTARYILFSAPYILILAAITFLLTFKKNHLVKYIMPALIIVLAAQALRFDFLLLTNVELAPLPRSERSGYLEEWTAGTGIKEVANFILAEHNKNPEVPIVIGTEGFFGTLPDGLQIYLQNVPNVIVIGIGLGINNVHESLVESFEAGNRTFLTANSSRLVFEGDFEEFGLKVVKEYKKADRPEGIKEFNQYGQFDTFYLLEVVNVDSRN